jgi:hypothetical protein
VADRQASKDQKISNKKSNGIPITVRQLEAIVRLSESIAKVHLSSIVEPSHVEEAHRIFKISTLNAAASGIGTASEAPVELASTIKKIEEAIKRRVAVGQKITYPKLQSEMVQRFDNAKAIEHVSYFPTNCLGDHRHGEEGRILPLRTEEGVRKKEMINNISFNCSLELLIILSAREHTMTEGCKPQAPLPPFWFSSLEAENCEELLP